MARQTGDKSAARIDLAEAHRLLSALERDLHKVEAGQGDVSALREEVKALAAALESPSPDHGQVRQGLHSMHGTLSGLADTAAGGTLRLADYLARIGRMLGM